MSERWNPELGFEKPDNRKSVEELIEDVTCTWDAPLEIKWEPTFLVWLVKYGSYTASGNDLRVALVELLEGLKS